MPLPHANLAHKRLYLATLTTCHKLAEAVRFELTEHFCSAVFKTAGLNHSPKPPTEAMIPELAPLINQPISHKTNLLVPRSNSLHWTSPAFIGVSERLLSIESATWRTTGFGQSIF
jgi:hypothetical protein